MSDINTNPQTNPNPGTSNDNKPPEQPGFPWKDIVGGIALIGLGIYSWFRFSNWEESGGTIRENRILLFFYDICGKTGTLLIFCIGGALIIGFAIKKMMAAQNNTGQ